MTVSAAQAAAASLRDALQDYGVRTSIELQPGVGPSNDPWGPAPFVRNLGHHIASYPPGTPGLAVVKGGRKGASPLQGPLANCYGGFDLIARIITMGWANHPGAGGPWPVPGWGTVPRDNGRPYILGWEFEGGYLPYTDEMHDFMSRCGAASLDWLGTHNRREPAPLECHDEHKGWAGPRKPDRIGYTTASGRQRIAAVRGTGPKTRQEDDMPYIIRAADRAPAVLVEGSFIGLAPGTDELKNWMAVGAKEVWVMPFTWDAYDRGDAFRTATRLSQAQDKTNALLEQLITKISNPTAAAGLTAAQMADAVNDEADRRGRDGDPATGPVS